MSMRRRHHSRFTRNLLAAGLSAITPRSDIKLRLRHTSGYESIHHPCASRHYRAARANTTRNNLAFAGMRIAGAGAHGGADAIGRDGYCCFRHRTTVVHRVRRARDCALGAGDHAREDSGGVAIPTRSVKHSLHVMRSRFGRPAPRSPVPAPRSPLPVRPEVSNGRM